MANVVYFDAVWMQDILGGDRIGLMLQGVGFGTAVTVTGWPVGQNGPVLAIDNIQVDGSNFLFNLVNVGPGSSVIEATNLAFSLTSQ
jgi:hypothetical protein